MATTTETGVVYAAGVVQGIALVTFPAASTIFTDPAEYDLSSTQYGTLFLPQVVAAITAALLGASLTDLDRDDDGFARVPRRDPENDAALTLWVDESYSYLMLFTGDPLPDVRRRSLAVEAMTCPPNALRTGDALIRLKPGDSTTSAWAIVATARVA